MVANGSRKAAGCTNRPSSKAAASEGPEAYPLGYVEDLNDARTMLADFFNSLLHMIAQHDLLRMRIEIYLITNVADIEDLDVVFDQRQRDNQGREFLMIITDHAQ